MGGDSIKSPEEVMLKIEKNTNGEYVVNAQAKLFIVPNRARSITGFPSSTHKRAERDANINGITLDGSEEFVECWID